MKVFYNYTLILIMITLFFTACQTEQEIVEEEETREIKDIELAKGAYEIVTIKHKYNYYGKEFQITYIYNNESEEVLEFYGDEDTAKEVFSEEGGPQGTLVTSIVEDADYKEISMSIFDTASEIDSYIETEIEGNEPTKSKIAARNNCFNVDLPGNDEIRFFEDIDYLWELNDIRGLNKRTYGIQYLAHNNDRISSFYIRSIGNTQVSFYEHSCYSGKRLTFYKYHTSQFYGINNLRHYHLSGALWWKKSWNDQISSFWMP